ncbi:tyrosine-type recombinase/integrase [Marinobacter sp. DY40_1A1]|uniref:tyrosine-type recombinase/integrase n=1 Tax=Marinobacter sp. DY40_1A1 TaxID=2583229 RepID=UPI001907F0C2|nr:site-specific integrase [Marinobacter sp. DY40_1A1]MBK1885591.1 site-specific integrase [Marinobacter sp. DY40_1A1]
MASITARKRADGSKAYRADVRVKRDGKVVYQESRTFDRKALAKDWSSRRELELQEPGALLRIQHRGVTVENLIDRYLDEFGRGFGRSKRHHLEYLKTFDIAEMDAIELTTQQIVAHVVNRGKPDAQGKRVQPQTINNDLIWLRSVFKTARSAWGIPAALEPLNDASETCRRERLVGKSKKRDRRPTLEELNRLLEYAAKPSGKRSIPIADIVLFALFSSRRQSEICRLEWASLDYRNRSVVVSDMKSPTGAEGNNRVVYLTEEAWAIIQRQPKIDKRIFPSNSKSIGTRFHAYCQFLGIKDLRFHDLRHECISWLFELGWEIPRVASVSGHQSWAMLQRYTHISRQESHDKYEGWPWRPAIPNRD